MVILPLVGVKKKMVWNGIIVLLLEKVLMIIEQEHSLIR